MPLTAGTRLGPYEILAPLGAGSMGKARDTRIFLKAARFTPGFLAWGDTLDGQRFLMVEPAKAQAVQSLTVLFNWQEAVRR
jgi:hypothetical protein